MSPPTPLAIVVFGVSGSGKTTVGRLLARELGADFCDADDLHGPANIEKMRSGHPLTDEDRWPWLRAVGEQMSDSLARGAGVVSACSALKKSYRDVLRGVVPPVFFVQLDGAPDLIGSRMATRKGSFMPPSLLSSQFMALEPLEMDEAGMRVDTDQSPQRVVRNVLRSLPANSPRGPAEPR